MRWYLLSLAFWFGLDAVIAPSTRIKSDMLRAAIQLIPGSDDIPIIVTVFGAVALICMIAAVCRTDRLSRIAMTAALSLSLAWIVIIIVAAITGRDPDWPRAVFWAWAVFIQIGTQRFYELFPPNDILWMREQLRHVREDEHNGIPPPTEVEPPT